MAADAHQAAVPDGRWQIFVFGLVLMCADRRGTGASAARADTAPTEPAPIRRDAMQRKACQAGGRRSQEQHGGRFGRTV